MVMIHILFLHTGETFAFFGRIRTIAQLKTALLKHIHPFNQLILYKGNLLLDPRTELSDLGIGDDDEVEMQVSTRIFPQKIAVEVKTETDTLNFSVLSNHTVYSLKEKIDEEKGISPHRQHLKTLGTSMYNEMLMDMFIINDTPVFYLREIPPDPRSNIKLRVNFPNAENNEKVVELEVGENDTVYTLHGIIRLAGLAEGHNFYLVWGNRRLEGRMTLTGYNIQSGDNIYLFYPGQD